MDGIERIELPTPFGVGTVNCYAIDGDGLSLVDPGPDAEDTFEALDAGLAGLGYDLADVDRVLITHEHMDHFGGAHRIQAEVDASVLAHRVAAERIADPDGHFDREQAFFTPFLVSMGVPDEVADAVTGLPEPYAKFHEPVDADRVLEDGDV
ncbi:MAG TPA: MBL fold metallo-hydrolase, partial [Halobacteriales archaeon]|nr:MBL fold metallo-hydrolase [Halobacteriales archaeon]